MINNLLAATDGSEHAKKAVEPGADIAPKYGATVYLVHAAPETDTAVSLPYDLDLTSPLIFLDRNN